MIIIVVIIIITTVALIIIHVVRTMIIILRITGDIIWLRTNGVNTNGAAAQTTDIYNMYALALSGR